MADNAGQAVFSENSAVFRPVHIEHGSPGFPAGEEVFHDGKTVFGRERAYADTAEDFGIHGPPGHTRSAEGSETDTEGRKPEAPAAEGQFIKEGVGGSVGCLCPRSHEGSAR